MAHSYTVRRGAGGRIKNAFAGLILGPILVFASIWLLSWNEHRAFERTQALKHGQKIVVAGNAEAPFSALDGALVHFTGNLVGIEPVSDDVFGVETDAVALRRDVWMYQWVETRRTTDDTTTYTYSKEWKSRHIESSGFHRSRDYANPPEFPYPDQTWLADEIDLGAVPLGESMRAEIDFFEPMPLPETSAVSGYTPQGEWLSTVDGEPQIGDTRIRFEIVPEGPASAVGLFEQNALLSYQTDWGPIALIEIGIRSSDELFEQAHRENLITTWLYRFGGVILAGIGCAIFVSPLTTIVGFVPLIGPLIRSLGGAMAFGVGAMIAICTIAVAWFAVRPMLSLALIAAALVIVGAVRRLGAKGEDQDVPVT
ncbi:MAG: TMEM43 family protein [Pseudomonadota bacterium]